MGDRALIQLVCGNKYSPTLYLHWAGDRAEEIIQQTKERMCGGGFGDDLEYAFARLVQIAIGNDAGASSYGVTNATGILTAEDSPGDNGCFIVDMKKDWKVRQIGAPKEYSFTSPSS